MSADQEARDEDRQVRPQNQVALIAVCDILPTANENEDKELTQTNKLYPPPPMILVTTHLKVQPSAFLGLACIKKTGGNNTWLSV